MRARSLVLSAFAGLSLLSLAVVSSVTPAAAQNPPSDNVAQLDLQGADVRQALRDLFRTAGHSYTIAPDVQGPVTLSLRNVSFDTALQNITRQVDATYRVENGAYAIVRSDQAAGPEGRIGAGGFGQGGFGGGAFGGQGGFGQGGFGQGTGQVGAEPPVMTIDGDFVYVLRRGVLYKVEKKSLKLVGQIPLGPVGGGGFGRPGGAPGGGGLGGGGLGGGRPGQP